MRVERSREHLPPGVTGVGGGASGQGPPPPASPPGSSGAPARPPPGRAALPCLRPAAPSCPERTGLPASRATWTAASLAEGRVGETPEAAATWGPIRRPDRGPAGTAAPVPAPAGQAGEDGPGGGPGGPWAQPGAEEATDARGEDVSGLKGAGEEVAGRPAADPAEPPTSSEGPGLQVGFREGNVGGAPRGRGPGMAEPSGYPDPALPAALSRRVEPCGLAPPGAPVLPDAQAAARSAAGPGLCSGSLSRGLGCTAV